MKKVWLGFIICFLAAPVLAQENSADELSAEEAAAVAAILAKTAAQQAQEAEDKIVLPEETKQQAFDEVNPPNANASPLPADTPVSADESASLPADTPQADSLSSAPQSNETASAAENPASAAQPPAAAAPDLAEQPLPDDTEPKAEKCLPVAYIDIDEAFNEHPRTIAVKKQIRLKILSKEEEVRGAKELIKTLEAENRQMTRQVRELKPYYERIVAEPQPLLPKIEESADSLLLGNILNRLTFSGAEILSTSPLNTPAELEDLTARIVANKKIIAEREFFIDNYKYTTREEILKLEKKEVNEILKDIYIEIKSFAKKRNVGAIVRKEDLLYGERPVNVTKDFIDRLKKSKKYRKRG